MCDFSGTGVMVNRAEQARDEGRLDLADETPLPQEVEFVATIRFTSKVRHWPRRRGVELKVSDDLFLASLSDEDSDAAMDALNEALDRARADKTGVKVETE